jgi:hypothetical protein
MSSPNCDSDIALPHAGLLSYFVQHEVVSNYDRSAETTHPASTLLREERHRVFDEEAQFKLRDASSTAFTECEDLSQPMHHSYQGVFHSLQDLWNFLCVVTLVSCATYLGLDLVLSQYGMGMGLTDRIMGKHLPSLPMAREVSGLQTSSHFFSIILNSHSDTFLSSNTKSGGTRSTNMAPHVTQTA